MARSIYRFMDKVYAWTDKRPNAKKAIVIGILLVIIAIGIYLRALPAFKYGLELHANDPWIEYWQANYTYTHGLTSWYSLTKSNPDTHLFWYPWGRDFTKSSYPGLPLWTAVTYNIVKPLGLSIKDWVVLQPLVFTFIAFITIYLAAKEISGGRETAGLMAALLYSLVPAASDRSIVGFVEKEGIALGFIFLAVYLYAKMIKSLGNKGVGNNKKLMYATLTGLSIAIVGWFWGGYIYVLGSLIAFLVLYPLFSPKEITAEFIEYNLLVVITSLIFVSLSPSIISQLGLYPLRISLGALMLGLLILPVIYMVFANNYKILGLRKPLLNVWRYAGLLFVVIVVGVAMLSMGIISISARYAWALGLHFVKAPPLVRSVEEHQPALEAAGITGVLNSWGTGIMWLFFASPLIIAIFGALYLLYRGGAEKTYLAISFLVAFYAYMNASYFEATAAAYGLLVAGVFAGYLWDKTFPSKEEVLEWKRGRIRLRTSTEFRAAAAILLVLVLVNLGFSGYGLYRSHSSMIYSIMAGGAPINARTDAWYDTLDFLRKNTSKDSLVVSWWDYGYWISVGAHRMTMADGATLNGTQISLLAKILTAKNSSEAVELLKKIRAPFNKTYILVFDVFQFQPQKDNPNSYLVIPVRAGAIVGLVDIPKSRWMIEIGGRDMANYFYVYVDPSGRMVISPRFDQPDQLALIYKILIDGILYLNEQDKNHTYYFAWYTGTPTQLRYDVKARLQQYGLNIKYEIDSYQTKTLTFADRPLANDPYIKPYKVIAEPFYGVSLQGGAALVEVICIYEVDLPPSQG